MTNYLQFNPYSIRVIARSVALSLAILISFSQNLNSQTILALSGNNLISFKASAPGILTSSVSVTGIAVGQNIEGLDFRPNTGQLYALGYNQNTGEARLYTIDVISGAATAIGTDPIALKATMGKVSMDFNPTVDRVRVTGSDNSNYRMHPVTGVLAATDMALNFAAGDLNFGINPAVGAGAYTNSFGGATTTTLYNYDDSLNVLTTQVPPNNGTLNTIGQSGILVNLADPTNDLDIFFNQYGTPNRAYLAANVGSSTFDNLYTLNLSTGAATLVGQIGTGIAVTDIAIMGQAVENSCDAKTVECVKYELLNISKNNSGDKTYRIRITNNCTDKLVYAAFQLPNGISAVGLANNSTFNSVGGHNYEVRNPNFSPFYSVRFKDQSVDGIANGQADLFEYTLPATANPNYIHVVTRIGNTSREAYINVFGCTVGATSASRPESEDREEESTLSSGTEYSLFPNPTSGVLFADLSAWEGQQIQLRAYNAQGQMIQYQSVTGGSAAELITLPVNLSDGLYFLEMRTTSGQKQVRKIMVQRG